MNGNTYEDKDMVDVVDESGAVSTVPKAWLEDGVDLLPAGTKKATAKDVKAAEDTTGGDSNTGSGTTGS